MPEMTSPTDVSTTNDVRQKPFITEFSSDEESSDEQEEEVTRNVLVLMSDIDKKQDTVHDVEKIVQIVDETEEETDLEIEEEKKTYHLSGSTIYLDTCKDLNVTPVSYFIRHMKDERLTMRHHGIGPSGAKALSVPLQSNTFVTSLDLSDNGLEGEGAVHLAEMLKENCYITYLSLSDNQMGSDGATALCRMLLYNTSLYSVNFSGNGFSDKDAEKFAQAISENTSLREMNLSHNNFGENLDSSLGQAIGENETLEMIDFSWNHFRGKSALNLIQGITINSRLKRVNLAWNGLSDEGAAAIAECLKTNHIITELDISNNRITPDGATYVARALETNETLRVLKIGQNPIDITGALSLLNYIDKANSTIQELDLTDVCVDKTFDKIHKEMLQRRDIVITHGGVLGSFGMNQDNKNDLDPKERAALKALENFLKNDPMAILQMHVESKNLRLLDLFRDLDKNNDYRISVEDLKRKVKAADLDISEDKIDKLVSRMDKDNDGMVDYSSMAEGKAETVIKQRRLSRAVIETFEASGRTSLPAELASSSVIKFLRTRAPKTIGELLPETVANESNQVNSSS